MFITIIIHVVLPKYDHNTKVLPSELKKARVTPLCLEPQHSTITALADVCKYLYGNMSNKLLTDAVFLGLKKAFGTADVGVLVTKLNPVGIDGNEIPSGDLSTTSKGEHYVYTLMGNTSELLGIWNVGCFSWGPF